MAKPRVLVVDDSVVARRLVSSALASDGSVEVVGVAADGRVALASIERLRPDAVTLDVDMPVMDGLETLEAIRERWPHLVVIMFSTYTARGAQITLDASSCAITRAPVSDNWRAPRIPSLPIPVITMPRAWAP